MQDIWKPEAAFNDELLLDQAPSDHACLLLRLISIINPIRAITPPGLIQHQNANLCISQSWALRVKVFNFKLLL